MDTLKELDFYTIFSIILNKSDLRHWLMVVLFIYFDILWTYYHQLTNKVDWQFCLQCFLFSKYLLIRLNISFYVILIHKWPKIRTWFRLWLIVREFQFLKYIEKTTISFSEVCFILRVSFSSSYLRYSLLVYNLPYFP